MGNLWLKIKIWSKITVSSLLVFYALFFIARNSGNSVKLWVFFFQPDYETSILYFTLSVFLIGVIGTILVRTTFKTIRQIRELKQRNRTQKLQSDIEDMKFKAAKLQPPEAAPAVDDPPPTV